MVRRVFIRFVFNGSPEEAERSIALEALRENLEGKKFLIDQFFEHPVSLVIEFRSARTRQVGGVTHQKKTYAYPLALDAPLECTGSSGERMHVGFARLVDLNAMYRDMGNRFFDRNIRAGLSEDEAPNRAIKRALKAIVLDGAEEPDVFAFNHNGVTLHAQHIITKDGVFEVVDPRLLNGAQTVTTLNTFIEQNAGNKTLEVNRERLERLRVLCRVITKADDDFVQAVTINNNRQNPVRPWNLRANDMIQLELADKFRADVSLYYERQEKMFSSLTDDELEDMDVSPGKAVELLRLAKTYLVSDGMVDRLSDMRQVFESDKMYQEVFSSGRLNADSRKVLLCYKIQFRLRKLVRTILETGVNKYAFMKRGRNLLWALLCQAVLNDEDEEWYCDNYGTGLTVEADYTAYLAKAATSRVRFLISDVIEQEPYASQLANEKLSFIKNRTFFNRCMARAAKKWHWTHQRLK